MMLAGPMKLGLLATIAITATASAELEFPTRSVDLKPDLSDSFGVAKFSFENTGSQPISISQITPSCSCLTATSDKYVIPAREKGIVKVKFDYGARVGPQEKQVAVSVEGTTTKPIILTVKATIPSLLTLDPPTLQWTDKDKSATKKCRIKLAPDAPSISPTLGSDGKNLYYQATLEKVDDLTYEISVTPAHSNHGPMTIRLPIETGLKSPRHEKYLLILDLKTDT